MINLDKYNEIIIWGAAFPPSEVGTAATSHGHSMDKLAGLLKAEGAFDKVIAFVDSNKSVQGRLRMGIPVYEPSEILSHPDALVVINSISIRAIRNAMLALGAGNDCAVIPYYFYHGTLDYPYDNKTAWEDALEHEGAILGLYEQDDALTERYLDIILNMRKSGMDRLYDISFYDGTGEHIAYFCDEALSPKGDVTYIDVGAFDGDSLAPVENRYAKRLKRYIAFEPDPDSLSKLQTFVNEHGLGEKATLLPYALGNSDGQIRFSVSGGTSQQSEHGEIVLEQRRFDGLKQMETVGDAMVKMDIEGAEMGALRGMQTFIRMHTPYLAICIYHRECDLYEIARYIKELNPAYRLYIRGGWHLECWAVPARHFERKEETT